MNNNQWAGTTDFIRPVNTASLTTTIPQGVWELGIDRNGWWLNKTADTFTLPTVQYPIYSDFIDRVTKAWSMSDKSMGVLFTGTKGSGKTVVAKTIANLTGLPVVCITTSLDNLGDFLDSVSQPIVVLIDEFEKLYSTKQSNDKTVDDVTVSQQTLLSVLDGLSNSKVLWLLTANRELLDENLISRPSRIRYKKAFDSLSMDQIRVIVAARSTRPEFNDEIEKVFAAVASATVDVVAAFVDEVNIFGVSPFQLLDGFNVEMSKSKWTVTLVDPDSGSSQTFNNVALTKDALYLPNCRCWSYESFVPEEIVRSIYNETYVKYGHHFDHDEWSVFVGNNNYSDELFPENSDPRPLNIVFFRNTGLERAAAHLVL